MKLFILIVLFVFSNSIHSQATSLLASNTSIPKFFRLKHKSLSKIHSGRSRPKPANKVVVEIFDDIKKSDQTSDARITKLLEYLPNTGDTIWINKQYIRRNSDDSFLYIEDDQHSLWATILRANTR